MQAQGYGSNLMDTDASEELLLLPEEVEPFNTSPHQGPIL